MCGSWGGGVLQEFGALQGFEDSVGVIDIVATILASSDNYSVTRAQSMFPHS